MINSNANVVFPKPEAPIIVLIVPSRKPPPIFSSSLGIPVLTLLELLLRIQFYRLFGKDYHPMLFYNTNMWFSVY